MEWLEQNGGQASPGEGGPLQAGPPKGLTGSPLQRPGLHGAGSGLWAMLRDEGLGLL